MGSGFPSKLMPVESFCKELSERFQGLVFLDVESTDRVIVTRVNDLKYSRKSQFQQIDIFDTPSFGLCLALDGLIQISQADEALYHEFFIHPACVLNPDATSAVILGGGDGCAAREILKYRNMSTIEMVEIDPLVIDACREHFKSVNAGAMDNPRLKIIVDDAVKYLKEDQHKKFDLIFADLTEPYDLSGVAGDLSRDFFSASFYDTVKARMNPEGILTVQTGGIANIPELDTFHYSIIDGLCQSFKTVYTAYIHVHSFVQCWSITLASDYPYKIDELDPVPVMERLGITGLKYYNRVSHQKAFWKANP